MPPFDSLVVLTAGALIGLAMLAVAGAWAWRQWLALKRDELGHGRSHSHPPVAGRIELADLRERVKKLEAIAAGVDL